MATPPPLYVFSLGPVETDAGAYTAYVGWLDGRLVNTSEPDADAALHALRRAAPLGTPLWCTPELARTAVLHGFRSGPLPEEVLRARAELAILLAHVDVAPKATKELGLVLEACRALFEAKPWGLLPSDVALDVELRGAFTGRYEASVLGQAGDEFGLLLFPDRGAVARITGASHPSTMRKMVFSSLSLEPEPAFARHAVEAACGAPCVPILLEMRKGKTKPLARQELIALVGTALALGDPELAPGETYTARLEVEPEGEVSVSVTLPPAD